MTRPELQWDEMVAVVHGGLRYEILPTKKRPGGWYVVRITNHPVTGVLERQQVRYDFRTTDEAKAAALLDFEEEVSSELWIGLSEDKWAERYREWHQSELDGIEAEKFLLEVPPIQGQWTYDKMFAQIGDWMQRRKEAGIA